MIRRMGRVLFDGMEKRGERRVSIDWWRWRSY
jgi:hypothetical protein